MLVLYCIPLARVYDLGLFRRSLVDPGWWYPGTDVGNRELSGILQRQWGCSWMEAEVPEPEHLGRQHQWCKV